VEDFGALNNAQPDSESNPVVAASETALELPPETVKGVPDAPQPLRPAEACRQLPRRGLRIL
jgi:hypothetical protein